MVPELSIPGSSDSDSIAEGGGKGRAAPVMPHSSKSTAAPAHTKPKSLLAKGKLKGSSLRQVALSFGPAAAASSSSACDSAPAPQLRQATLDMMSGVMDYRDEGAHTDLEVPTTLYLGAEDIARLKRRLEETTDRDELLPVLRRLSAMPCTRSLLASTRIGVTVGGLRKHPDYEVQDLASRIVKVWKAQLAEHQQQHRAASKR